MKKILASVAAVAVLTGPALVANTASADPYVPVTPSESSASMADPVVTPRQHPVVKFAVRTAGNTTARSTTTGGHVYATVKRVSNHRVTSISRFRYHSNNRYTLPTQRGSRAGIRYVVIMEYVKKGVETTSSRTRFTVKK